MLKLFAAETKEMLADFAHLNFFGTFGDAVAAVMAVDVLKGHMSAVANSATGLHRPIGGITDQTISSVIAHRHKMRELHKAFNIGTITLHRVVHQRCGVTNELTQHGRLSV
jgi:hypothetical protein